MKLSRKILTFLFLFLFLGASVSFAQQTKGKQVDVLPSSISFEQQADEFANKIGYMLDLSDNQIQEVKTLRISYLKNLEAIKAEMETTPRETLIERGKKLQADYDTQFNAILTDEQKERIRNRDYRKK